MLSKEEEPKKRKEFAKNISKNKNDSQKISLEWLKKTKNKEDNTEKRI